MGNSLPVEDQGAQAAPEQDPGAQSLAEQDHGAQSLAEQDHGAQSLVEQDQSAQRAPEPEDGANSGQEVSSREQEAAGGYAAHVASPGTPASVPSLGSGRYRPPEDSPVAEVSGQPVVIADDDADAWDLGEHRPRWRQMVQPSKLVVLLPLRRLGTSSVRGEDSRVGVRCGLVPCLLQARRKSICCARCL